MPESKLLYFADLFDNTANISRISKTTDDHVIATTYSGGKPVTPQLYMSAIQAIKPATFAALVDLIYPAARTGPLSTLVPSARRLSKSLQRSIKWLDECIELNETSAQRPPLLFAHLGGGSSVELRHKWAELVKQRDEAVSGIIISDNALSPNDSKMNLDVYEASLEPFASNERITKMAYGFGRPDHSLLMISRFGVDMIDASAYIHDATNRGRAFTFTFGSLDGSLGPSNGNAKQPFTRAYIHHLLATHEMLAQVLLMSHNVHHMDRFYADIRASIARGTFTSDMNSFLARYNFEADETQVDKGEQITMAAVQQSVASARISSSS
ncbi:tRNA-guanine transglycosylase [Ramicandelaber brevisporus]|nr:tRNA-guanine transglycosylase [Ramicandelaber brevisporus]